MEAIYTIAKDGSEMIMNKLRHLSCFTLMTFLSFPVFAQANISVRIVETYPPSEIILYAREPLYVRIAYQSDIPLRFQAAGYFVGVEIQKSAAMNPAPSYPPGSGEAIGWISYGDQTMIDEIRLNVFDDKWKKLDTLSATINMKWNGVMPQTWREPAAWVNELNTIQQNMTSQGLASSGQESSWWGVLLMLMGWSIPGYFILQIYMFLKYRDGWRTAALLPLWVMVPLVGYTLFALISGSNLWPLMMLFLTPFAFIYLFGVWLAKNFWKHADTSVST